MARVSFVKSATSYQQFPAKKLPEVAIVGRSNSGKSSLINALAKHKIAKVGQKPGKTRLLNIFEIDRKVYLVDMPGYGYAARSQTERKQWEKMIEKYLFGSENLKGLVLLMDIRRKWSDDEGLIFNFCESKDIPMIIGLTKADKLSKSKWIAAQRTFEKEFGLPCLALSSEKNWGISELYSQIIKSSVES